MTDLLDLEHQRRSRAERVVTMLRVLWGDALPAGPHPELTVLIDAIAVDDEHGTSQHLVTQGDGLTFEMLAALCAGYRSGGDDRDAPSTVAERPELPDAVEVPTLLPDGLRKALAQSGLVALPVEPGQPSSAAAADRYPGAPDPAAVDDTATPAPGAGPRRASAAAARVGMWEVDPQTRTVAYDAVSAALMGQGEVAGHASLDAHLNDLIHPADRVSIEHAMQYALRTETTYRVRFRVLSPTGDPTWLISQGRVLRKPSDAGPRLTGYLIPDTSTRPRVEVLELT